jgi:hypothetical protein
VSRVLFSFVIIISLWLHAAARPIVIHVQTGAPAATVVPLAALGAVLDGHRLGDIDRLYAPDTTQAIASISFYRLAYQLRTELAVEAWHWNEDGRWSDPEHSQGYWTSSETSEKPILMSHGYRLPRRGSTEDQADNDGYSRIDDGDETSFWKSNPYLDEHFTGVDNAKHPQWVLIDLGEAKSINAIRIVWGETFAMRYEVQYWDGRPATALRALHDGRWRSFENGKVENGAGGDAVLKLSEAPKSAQYLRILLKKGSGEPADAKDIRDRLGFAIREIGAGALDARGRFFDFMTHSVDRRLQTRIVASSTDPWHRAVDRNDNTAQPGIDRVMQSGLTRGAPVLMPAGLLYDTPENVAAEIRFLASRGYDVRQVALGAEPDGQYVSPEHYAELFMVFAGAIHGVNPSLAVGGPGFQSETGGWTVMADETGRTSWMGRFLAALKENGRSGDFGFFSLEWYPFDDICKLSASEQLIAHPKLIRETLESLAADGVPKDIPWIVAEYGYSSLAGRQEVELPAALLNAEIAAQYLMAGVKTLYLYGVEPNRPISEAEECESWGNLMALEAGPDGKVKWRLPAFYGAQILATEWFGDPGGAHILYPATIQGSGGAERLAAFAVRRPDEEWALLLLNKDERAEAEVTIAFDDEAPGSSWAGPHRIIQYSPKQYKWVSNSEFGEPAFSNPPDELRNEAGKPLVLTLPPMSLTVVRGSRVSMPPAARIEPEARSARR